MIVPLGMKDRKRLRNPFLKNLSSENSFGYNQQINFCVSSINKTKLEYFNHWNQKNAIVNKLLWNEIKPFFLDKGTTTLKYNLIEDGEIIDDDRKMSSIFDDCFQTSFQT